MGQFAATGPQKFVALTPASSGDNAIIPGVSGKKIRLLALFLQAAGTVAVTFKSGVTADTPTALTGPLSYTVGQTLSLPFSEGGHFETATGLALNASLNGAVAMNGFAVYQEVL